MHNRALIFFCCLKPIADGFLGKIRQNGVYLIVSDVNRGKIRQIGEFLGDSDGKMGEKSSERTTS